LIFHTTQGIIVKTGCAHPGIVGILKRAKDLSKDDILLAMGGFHLGGNSKGDLEKIILSFRTLARIFHELLSRDHEDGRATWQPQGVGSEAYLNGTSQGPIPEDARKDGHIRGRSK
jgi:hypothetical protein